MRKLTFLGFLLQYLPTLSGVETRSLRELVRLSEQNPRLREPVFLYALEADKLPLLLRYAPDDSPFAVWGADYTKEQVHAMLEQGDPALPENFHKVWRSYQSVSQRTQHDDHTKALMRGKILQLQQEKGLSNYRLYTALQLNPGNVNAWLKHGDARKISLQAARRVLGYAQGYVGKGAKV